MPVKYTGRADTFTYHGLTYAKPELYKKHPGLYHASYDTAIRGLGKDEAERMASESKLHSFEDASTGKDLLEEATNPETIAAQSSLNMTQERK